jgi:hypothetical protein
MNGNHNPSHHDRQNEKGNVLFYILIAVALIAALSYAVAQSSRGSTNALSEERANLVVTEILDYANIVSSAVGQLKLRGCKETHLSFENSVYTGYTNVTVGAPTDDSCDVFHINGGWVEPLKPQSDWLDSSLSAEDYHGDILLTATTGIDLVGAASADLLLVIPFLQREVCIGLNNKLGVGVTDAAPPLDAGNSWDNTGTQFTGSFPGGELIQDAGNILDGKSTGCFEGDTNPAGGYHFYKVLLAR